MRRMLRPGGAPALRFRDSRTGSRPGTGLRPTRCRPSPRRWPRSARQVPAAALRGTDLAAMEALFQWRPASGRAAGRDCRGHGAGRAWACPGAAHPGRRPHRGGSPRPLPRPPAQSRAPALPPLSAPFACRGASVRGSLAVRTSLRVRSWQVAQFPTPQGGCPLLSRCFFTAVVARLAVPRAPGGLGPSVEGKPQGREALRDQPRRTALGNVTARGSPSGRAGAARSATTQPQGKHAPQGAPSHTSTPQGHGTPTHKHPAGATCGSPCPRSAGVWKPKAPALATVVRSATTAGRW